MLVKNVLSSKLTFGNTHKWCHEEKRGVFRIQSNTVDVWLESKYAPGKSEVLSFCCIYNLFSFKFWLKTLNWYWNIVNDDSLFVEQNTKDILAIQMNLYNSNVVARSNSGKRGLRKKIGHRNRTGKLEIEIEET